MRLNEDGRTVAACDLLVLQLGINWRFQEKERYDFLLKRMEELGMSKAGLEWYLDLRRYGGVKARWLRLGLKDF